jgi:ribose 1,5-bisphosphokinase PhnN
MVLFPSVECLVDAAVAEKLRAGDNVIAAAAAPAVSNAFRRVIEVKVVVIAHPAILLV